MPPGRGRSHFVVRHRIVEPELMDDPAIAATDHLRALRGLGRLNRISGSARIVFSALRDLAERGEKLRVLDLATGGGDVPIALHARARAAGVPLEIAACDISPTAVEHARHRAAVAGAEVHFFLLNALRDPIPSGYDVVVCSLFLHHLIDEHARELLSRMAAAARRRVIVNDLCRGRWNLMMVQVGARLLSRSPVVHVDGPRSVRAAFTPGEMRELARRAGLRDARVSRRWPARLLLTWDPPESPEPPSPPHSAMADAARSACAVEEQEVAT